MTPFNPIDSKNFDIYKNHIISSDGNHQFSANVKSSLWFLPKIVAKFIHWIRNPNERILTVRNAFQEYVKTQDKLTPAQQYNLYAHLRNFNTQVIKNHNKTLLFWTHVDPIDVKSLEDKLSDQLGNALYQLKHALAERSLELQTEAILNAEKVLGSLNPEFLNKKLSLQYGQVSTACSIQRCVVINEAGDGIEQYQTKTGLEFADLTYIDILKTTLQKLDDQCVFSEELKKALKDTAWGEVSVLRGKVNEILRKLNDKVNIPKMEPIIEAIKELGSLKIYDVLLKFYDEPNKPADHVQQLKDDHTYLIALAQQYPSYQNTLGAMKQKAQKAISNYEGAADNLGQLAERVRVELETELHPFIQLIKGKFSQHPFASEGLFALQELTLVEHMVRSFPMLQDWKNQSKEVLNECITFVQGRSAPNAPRLMKKWNELVIKIMQALGPHLDGVK